jgi:hypothetical protein
MGWDGCIGRGGRRWKSVKTFALGAFDEDVFLFSLLLAISPMRPDCQHEKH